MVCKRLKLRKAVGFRGQMMKWCNKCKKQKERSEFSKNHENKDGLQHWCKKCMREYKHEYYRRNNDSVKKYFLYEESHRIIDDTKQKYCTKCNRWKDEIQFNMHSRSKDGLGYDCKDCVRAYDRERYKKKVKILKRKYYRYEECHRVVDGVKQKRCRRCKSWKTESDFYKVRSHKDGLSRLCKECANKATNKSRKNRRMAMRFHK